MRNKIGVKASEFEPVNEEITAHMKKMDERLDALLERECRRVEGPAKRRQGPELEEAKQNVQKAIASLQSEPNKTYISALDRMTELMESLLDADDRDIPQLRERQA